SDIGDKVNGVAGIVFVTEARGADDVEGGVVEADVPPAGAVDVGRWNPRLRGGPRTNQRDAGADRGHRATVGDVFRLGGELWRELVDDRHAVGGDETEILAIGAEVEAGMNLAVRLYRILA